MQSWFGYKVPGSVGITGVMRTTPRVTLETLLNLLSFIYNTGSREGVPLQVRNVSNYSSASGKTD